jgi:hypothetical protein
LLLLLLIQLLLLQFRQLNGYTPPEDPLGDDSDTNATGENNYPSNYTISNIRFEHNFREANSMAHEIARNARNIDQQGVA